MRPVYLTFLLFFLIACKKEEDSVSCPIIEQNYSNAVKTSTDYIKAYPGSTWYFNNQADLECYGPVSIKIYIPNGTENGCDKIIENNILTPDHEIFGVMDGRYQLVSDTVEKITYRMPFYDTVLSTFYNRNSYHMDEEPGYIREYERSVIAIQDSIVLGDSIYYDIIKVKHSIRTVLSNGNTLNDDKYYTLAKDIGMVRYEYPKENEDVYCTAYFISE